MVSGLTRLLNISPPYLKYKMYHNLVICCKFEFLNDTEEGAIDSKLATDTKKIYSWLNFVSSLVRSPIGNGFLAWLVNQKTFSFFFLIPKILNCVVLCSLNI